MNNYVSKLLAIAENEIGYLEKKSNSKLDDKTANAGSANYTKYARDLDAIPNFYNGKKNGYAWCDVFTDWLFVQAFGVENAKKLLCQPDKSLGAGCGYSASYYKKNGQFHTSDPKPGDQIFFWNSKKDSVAHTGIVVSVDSTYVYTIEGNTSGASGVISNGGGVCKKKYSLTYSLIYGYGRPKYDEEKVVSTPAVKVDKKIDTVKEVQTWLNNSYAANLAVDGIYGPKTKAALVKVLQKAIGTTADGIYGPNTNKAIKNLSKGSAGSAVKALQGLLVCNGYPSAYVDGDFGNDTLSAVKAYQKKKGLDVDGIAGKNTFSALCK